MNPIAVKSFGIDAESGLEKEIQVVSLNIDTMTELINISYNVILKSPTGNVFSVVKSNYYNRSGVKFEGLRESQIGILITGLIEGDLAMINGPETIEQDLRQTTF